MNEQRIPVALFWRYIWGMISYWPQRYAIVALSWILFHTWPLLPGLLAKLFFDTLSGQAAGLNVATVVAFAAAVGLARVAIILVATVSGRPWQFKLRALLQRNILSRILERPGAKAVPGTVGEALATMRDDVDIIQLMTDWLFDLVAGLVFVIGGVAILLLVDARVTVLVFVPILVVIWVAHLARTRLEQAREHSRTATARVSGSIGEIFSAVQAIQIAGAETPVIAHLRTLGEQRRQAVLRDRLQNLGLDAIFVNTASLGAGLTLLVASSAMRSGEFTVGDFALFATYLMQVAEYTGFLGYLINTYRQSGVAFRRAIALLQGAPPERLVEHVPLHINGLLPPLEPPPTRNATPFAELAIQGLSVRHPGGAGVEHIDLVIQPGTLTVITGRIGSGKTTLLRAMLGLLEAHSGTLRWNGQTIDPASFLVPPRIAYTAQVPTLLSGTLGDNILLGWPDESNLAAATHSAVLERDLAGLANGLQTPIGARGVKLSGGQVQRTAAARMFVRDAEILVIDDLSSALDVETERELWRRLDQRRNSGLHPATIVAVSHRRALLERADQIVVLEAGRISATGTLAELLTSSDELRQLYQGELVVQSGETEHIT